mmetsp:Transcript_3787/g.9950  ORF Transcript_3787/g.9950 Transcript_3787/m.9950 type:complete len:211 (+) Transcript_3787:504-1136(+)
MAMLTRCHELPLRRGRLSRKVPSSAALARVDDGMHSNSCRQPARSACRSMPPSSRRYSRPLTLIATGMSCYHCMLRLATAKEVLGSGRLAWPLKPSKRSQRQAAPLAGSSTSSGGSKSSMLAEHGGTQRIARWRPEPASWMTRAPAMRQLSLLHSRPRRSGLPPPGHGERPSSARPVAVRRSPATAAHPTRSQGCGRLQSSFQVHQDLAS